MDEPEWREIRRTARANHMTVAEWVRQVLRAARRQQPTADSARKAAVIRVAVQHDFPTADIDQMNDEIERGYAGTGRE